MKNSIELLRAEVEMKEQEIRKLKTQIKNKETQQNEIECDPEDLAYFFDESLDEEGSIKVAGCTFYPSQILKECDPVAYRCGLNDYADLMFSKEETEEYQALQEEIDQLGSDIEDLENEIEDLQSQIADLNE